MKKKNYYDIFLQIKPSFKVFKYLIFKAKP